MLATFLAQALLPADGSRDVQEFLCHPAQIGDGVRADGQTDPYVIDLEVSTYDVEPPRVLFVLPDPYGQQPTITSIWWPRFEGAPPFEFALHHVYPYENGTRPAQLVCFSHSRDYYYTGHSPQPGQRWQQGKHTVAATLTRLRHVLTAPHYQGPSGVDPH